MNTKGIKFLAVLAVLAMAFAVIAVDTGADLDAEGAAVVPETEVKVHPTALVDNGEEGRKIADDKLYTAGTYVTSAVSKDSDGYNTVTISVVGLATHKAGNGMYGDWVGIGLEAPETAGFFFKQQVLTLDEVKALLDGDDQTASTANVKWDTLNVSAEQARWTGLYDHKSAQDWYEVYGWATESGTVIPAAKLNVLHVIVNVTTDGDAFKALATDQIKGTLADGVVIEDNGVVEFVEYTGTITVGSNILTAVNYSGSITASGASEGVKATVLDITTWTAGDLTVTAAKVSGSTYQMTLTDSSVTEGTLTVASGQKIQIKDADMGALCLVNNGVMSFNSAALLTTGTIENSKTLQDITTLSSGVIVNSGTITTTGTITVSDDIENTGDIVTAAEMAVAGNIIGGGTLDIGNNNFSIANGKTVEQNILITELDGTTAVGIASLDDAKAAMDDAVFVAGKAITVGAGGVISGKVTYVQAYTYNTDKTAEYATFIAELNLKASSADGAAALTITTGSLTIAGAIDGTLSRSYVNGASDDINIDSASVTGGNFTLSGKIGIIGTLTLTDTTASIGEKAVITTTEATSKIFVTSTSTLTVAGTVTGSGTIDNAGVTKQASTGKISVEVTTNAVIDEDDMSEINVDGETDKGDTVFPAKQTVNVNGSWELIQDSRVFINGKLVVPVGAVLTIDAGAELILASDAKFEIYGTVIVSESVTTGVNDGKITVDAGSVTISGTLNNNGSISVGTDQIVTVAEGGLFIVQSDGSINNATGSTFVVEKDAELRIFGVFDNAIIQNYGYVLIDSESPATGASYVYQMGDGAQIDVDQYTIDAFCADSARLVISDDGMHLFTYRDPETKLPAYVTIPNYDEIIISMNLSTVPASTGLYSVSFWKISVSSAVSSKATDKDNDPDNGIWNEKQYSKTMDFSGTMDVDYTYIGESTGSTDYTARATVAADGKYMNITKATYINDYVTFDNAATIKVTGPVETQSKDAIIRNSGTLTLADDGIISSMGVVINNTGTINAAKYTVTVADSTGKTTKMYVYTTIDTALAYINLSDSVHETEIVGTQTLTQSAFLRDGKTIVVNGVFNIGKSNGSDVILDVYNGGVVKGSKDVNVNGTLFAENKSNIRDKNIISDVYSEETDASGKPVKNGWARWTNLNTAVKEALPGTVIVIKKDTDAVMINSNLTIPAEVSVVLPSTSIGMLLKNGVTLTINGLLQAEAPIWAEQAFDLTAQKVKIVDGTSSKYSSAIVVNGALATEYPVVYADGLIDRTTPVTSASSYEDYDWMVQLGNGTAGTVGAPIAGAYFQTDDYYVIAGIEVAIDNIEDIQTVITLNGEISADNLIVTATDDCEEIIINNLAVRAGKATEGTIVPGEIITDALRMSSLTLDGMKLTVKGEITGVVEIGDDSVKFVGASKNEGSDLVIQKDSKAGHMILSGQADITDKNDSVRILAGTVLTDGITFTQATEAAAGPAYSTYVYVDTGATLQSHASNVTTIANAIVYGTVSVPSGMAMTIGNITLLGDISVAGASSTTSEGTLIVSGDFYVGMTEADHVEIGASAAIAGVPSLGNSVVVYVHASSTVDADFQAALDKLDKTEFIVEDALWFTAYAGTTADKDIEVSATPIDNANLDDWVDENGVSVADDNFIVTIGDVEYAYAELDYNLYRIVIIADQGIQNVSIDGKLLISDATGTDQFRTATPLISGTHEVKYELKKGYEGTAKLTFQSSDSDVGIDGLKVTVSGDAGTTYLQLKGVAEEPDQPVPEPEKESEWNVTTILLLVLVILIAIMAVIVALRLNRN